MKNRAQSTDWKTNPITSGAGAYRENPVHFGAVVPDDAAAPLRGVCENIPAWTYSPDSRRGRPLCLPVSSKAIWRWEWRTRATTGGCPYRRAGSRPARIGIARKSAQTRIRDRGIAGL